MPELTSQDRESYQKLYDAADSLKSLLCEIPNEEPKINNSFTLKELTNAFFGKLVKPEILASFEQLQAQVELTGGYLTMYQLFAEAIENIKDISKKDAIKDASYKLLIAIKDASYKLLMYYNQLKVSLEAIDDDFLDNVTIPCFDPLFLGLLKDEKDKEIRTWTQQLMSDQAPALTDSQVQDLINAWGTAVTKFVEDARKQDKTGDQVEPGNTKTIAHFFCIHDQLEGLYSELSTAVALNS
jgi:hypothetical protein